MRRVLLVAATLAAGLGLVSAAEPLRQKILENYTAEARQDSPSFSDPANA